MKTADELLQIVKERVDPDLLVEALEITTEELVLAFPDKILDNRYKFSDLEYEEYHE
jgi:hypothetical protein